MVGTLQGEEGAEAETNLHFSTDTDSSGKTLPPFPTQLAYLVFPWKLSPVAPAETSAEHILSRRGGGGVYVLCMCVYGGGGCSTGSEHV